MNVLLVYPKFPETFWSFSYALSFIGKKAAFPPLGLLGKERFHYWHLMFWTLFRRPRHLALAVTLSIYGLHYRRICERYIFEEQSN